MNNQTFGEYIIQLRQEKGMSQRKLAEIAEVTNSTVSRIESDAVKPDPNTIDKIANALEVDKNILLVKCGYSEIPEDFVVIARKFGMLSESEQLEVFKLFDETIDDYLKDLEDDDE